MNDVPDVLATGKGEEGVPVGDVEGFTVTRPARNDGTSVRRCAVTTTSCPRSTSARAVRTDHTQATGDEDHRTTS